MKRIDEDFTAGSVSCIKCVESEEKLTHKVLTVKAIE